MLPSSHNPEIIEAISGLRTQASTAHAQPRAGCVDVPILEERATSRNVLYKRRSGSTPNPRICPRTCPDPRTCPLIAKLVAAGGSSCMWAIEHRPLYTPEEIEVCYLKACKLKRHQRAIDSQIP